MLLAVLHSFPLAPADLVPVGLHLLTLLLLKLQMEQDLLLESFLMLHPLVRISILHFCWHMRYVFCTFWLICCYTTSCPISATDALDAA